MNYITAVKHAENFLDLLTPACKRIEIVGSCKRGDTKSRAEGVHDVEILLIQNDGTPRPAFGDKVIYKSHLDKLLAELESNGILKPARKPADGDKYKKREIAGADINGFNLDLFIVTPATWGIQNLIRTGNSWFSHRSVTNRNATAFDYDSKLSMPGFLPNDLQYIKGETVIKRGEKTLFLPNESDVFELIFGKWIEPESRREFALKVKL